MYRALGPGVLYREKGAGDAARGTRLGIFFVNAKFDFYSDDLDIDSISMELNINTHTHMCV